MRAGELDYENDYDDDYENDYDDDYDWIKTTITKRELGDTS